MPEPKALVRNAADPEQVRKGRETERHRRDRELRELRALLDTYEGRSVLWRFMAQCGVFKSIMEASARIYYNAGQQDVGHWLLAEIAEAEPNAYAVMMDEARKRDANVIEPDTKPEHIDA